MLSKANIFFGLYSCRRNSRKLLCDFPIQLKGGHWRGDGQLYWQNKRDMERVHAMFYGLPHSHRLANMSKLHKAAINVLNRTPVSRFRVDGSQDGPSVVYLSRDSSFKAFDFKRAEVTTLIDSRKKRKLLFAREHPIFEYFDTPDFSLSKVRSNLHLKTECLIDAPCMGTRHLDRQIALLEIIFEKYVQYARSNALENEPNLFMESFDLVASALDPLEREIFLKKRAAFIKLVKNVRTVESHLDFNLGNFIDAQDLLVCDISDVGLRLPVSYDIINLLLVDVYKGRSPNLLTKVRQSPAWTHFDSLLSIAYGSSEFSCLKSEIFMTFVLRNSPYVCERLFGVWSPGSVKRLWTQFAKAFPGWPFADDYEK